MYEYDFDALGGTVSVRTNENGSFLNVRFNDAVIEDSSGECLDWDFTGHLHGAALIANQNAQLKRAGEASLRTALESIPDLYEELNQ